MDKSREAFESCYSKKMGTPISVLVNLRSGDSYLETEGDRLALSWTMWQASRAALVVDISADDIKRIFLENGFKEKTQLDDSIDLNPYVYDAALTLLEFAAGITVK